MADEATIKREAVKFLYRLLQENGNSELCRVENLSFHGKHPGRDACDDTVQFSVVKRNAQSTFPAQFHFLIEADDPWLLVTKNNNEITEVSYKIFYGANEGLAFEQKLTFHPDHTGQWMIVLEQKEWFEGKVESFKQKLVCLLE